MKVGGKKTSETWLDRMFVEAVRVFVGRSHPFSFGYKPTYHRHMI
jgi:hypothetical protein